MSAALKATPPDPLLEAIGRDGFTLLRGPAMQALLGPAVTSAALEDFAASWGRLETDAFMADGGRYRRRRHANYSVAAGRPGIKRGPHRAHFQAVVHNSLNGGVERWFAPLEDAVAEGAPLTALLALGQGVAEARAPGQDWFIEVHQFRIEAVAGAPGYPTPEGTHHDGVDYVLIGMIARTNLVGGETLITDGENHTLASFTLQDRLDTAFIDDVRVMHGVTPVQPADPALPSCRDVLVITWKRGGPPG